MEIALDFEIVQGQNAKRTGKHALALEDTDFVARSGFGFRKVGLSLSVLQRKIDSVNFKVF